eukprot:TRINITY_DN2584_c1_g1_i1.p1 TRINITY_DN2584_c1_g1~~TRINITY_DN2584_c1_g1_i1.p1  ORF type:complete len:746 (-),score=175.41 TRINITY_DN2584_c1_g1_i1:250-2487(-)
MFHPDNNSSSNSGTSDGESFSSCELCGVFNMPNLYSYYQHMKGRRHKENLIMRNGSKPSSTVSLSRPRRPRGSTGNIGFHCEVCGLRDLGKASYDQHVLGKKHRENLESSKTKSSSGAKFSVSRRNADKQAIGNAGFHCFACGLRNLGEASFDAHILGQKHMMVLKSLEGKGGDALYCFMCDTRNSTPEELQKHLGSDLHRQNNLKRFGTQSVREKDPKRVKGSSNTKGMSSCQIETVNALRLSVKRTSQRGIVPSAEMEHVKTQCEDEVLTVKRLGPLASATALQACKTRLKNLVSRFEIKELDRRRDEGVKENVWSATTSNPTSVDMSSPSTSSTSSTPQKPPEVDHEAIQRQQQEIMDRIRQQQEELLLLESRVMGEAVSVPSSSIPEVEVKNRELPKSSVGSSSQVPSSTSQVQIPPSSSAPRLQRRPPVRPNPLPPRRMMRSVPRSLPPQGGFPNGGHSRPPTIGAGESAGPSGWLNSKSSSTSPSPLLQPQSSTTLGRTTTSIVHPRARGAPPRPRASFSLNNGPRPQPRPIVRPSMIRGPVRPRGPVSSMNNGGSIVNKPRPSMLSQNKSLPRARGPMLSIMGARPRGPSRGPVPSLISPSPSLEQVKEELPAAQKLPQADSTSHSSSSAILLKEIKDLFDNAKVRGVLNNSELLKIEMEIREAEECYKTLGIEPPVEDVETLKQRISKMISSLENAKMFCSDCECWVNGGDEWDLHLESKSHLKAVTMHDEVYNGRV